MTTLNLKTLRYEIADGIGVVTFDEAGSPVNTMCEAWQADMVRLAEQVRADRARAVAAADGATGRASSGDPGQWRQLVRQRVPQRVPQRVRQRVQQRLPMAPPAALQSASPACPSASSSPRPRAPSSPAPICAP